MKKYQLKNLDCANCAAKIEDGVGKLSEVQFVNVNFANLSMTIETDDIDRVRQKIRELEPDVEVTDNDDTPQLIAKSELAENRGTLVKAGIATALLVLGIIFKDVLAQTPYHLAEYAVFVAAWLISGWKVIAGAIRNIVKGRVFDEQFLMTVATLGAFAIGEMPEAVAVMLFYVVGELFQDIAVGRSRKSIKALLEIKPEFANVKQGAEIQKVSPEEVQVGDVIVVKAGEKVPLDGTVLEGSSFVDTATLTGESVPRKVNANDEIMAGMINQSGLLTIQVNKTFSESSISKILELVENATARKARTEKFITTFAKYYTPVVVIGALLLAVLPPLFIAGATFSEWIYRALVVLVISCPCALVISIPLGYFGGVGRASKHGILVKGSNFLDALTQVRTVVFDKTGTLTQGEFKVTHVVTVNGYNEQQLLEYAAIAESGSNHPIAQSILDAWGKPVDAAHISTVKEISGHGVVATANGNTILAGNDKLLHRELIEHDSCDVEGTVVHVAVDKTYAGYLVIADRIKEDAAEAIRKLKKRGMKTVMLTGDETSVARSVAEKLQLDSYYAELLPEDKVRHIEALLDGEHKVAFVGDGINDAPVIARADVGMAMGALGSDAAIETADVVLMTDSPAKVVDAIDVAGKTRRIVWQNIIFALGVKFIFILLGIAGIANMWEAVFGDMGVALLAVFNSIRVLRES
ncbi:heavy metal translocating P-type ATPase [Prolixibacter denitrificans]|uniref:Cadmium, zinc and cobalt-transporting ATPase n=1 Tax=Prolixibacter denitrificans TaxID=1541063 RepID=A0A2P8C767_9BACT|nr:heavy metal translocating P-type ATPase [Prolixibacter denitrificans]PSK80812.1 Cd2+/Zn2+-exporting ATPase [Prolixibacter denitrificans]GET22387.1 zinc-transporting ATPase [Prolixibacter denitrificans]